MTTTTLANPPPQPLRSLPLHHHHHLRRCHFDFPTSWHAPHWSTLA
ncbi:hypothetical protein TIFTF001_026311 [Ficus carica]|uniref:Uncharacterized protein n=1 Tax=Ficus carica TaxID=3494 RepID=A0AA88IWP9_FICCA|nr:hypothetical protein TIFTF001_026311 [Ficus carica]